MQVDPVKTTTSDVMQIGDVKVVVKDVGKGPMVFGKLVNLRHQNPFMADDYEASSSSTNKCSQPKCCPPGLTNTQKRRLHRLQHQEQKEQEAKRLRDEQINKCGPIFPQSKVWRVKSANQAAELVESSLLTGLTASSNRSDRLSLQFNRKPNRQRPFWFLAMKKHHWRL